MLRISASSAITAFSALNEPVAVVALGESFECETQDCYGGQISSESVLRPDIDMTHFNRATGPVEITGVARGDVIRIEIEAIELASTGIMALSPGLGILGSRVEHPSTRIVPVTGGKAWVTPECPVPIAPMVGVLGIAPPHEPVGTSWPGNHGGNLDTRLLQAGSALFLRVSHNGALLAAGDLHAVQGDGELGGTGVEISGKVRLRVERTSYPGQLPAVRHPGGLSVLSSDASLETAIRNGFTEAVRLIESWHQLSWEDAYRVTSLIVGTEVSQVVNPLSTARVTLPREWCPDYLYDN